ncbi:hypothetical protein [Acinetobacter chengduensis]|nr:hypothetical protein [Acinetobacter chengduensis]
MAQNQKPKLPHELHVSISSYAQKTGIPMQTVIKKLIKKGQYVHG